MLRLKSGHCFKGISFGAARVCRGETVFTTSMVGYPESMTDPSYRGQILVFTQPLIGNYGVPSSIKDKYGLRKYFESDRIQVEGIVVGDYSEKYSHWNAVESLGEWCKRLDVPGICGVDTRLLVCLLREQGSTCGEISSVGSFMAPNTENLTKRVSTTKKKIYNPNGNTHIALIDCGVKHNIIRILCELDAKVTLVPWDYDITLDGDMYKGVMISNGPGDPILLDATVNNIKKLINSKYPIPIFGVCMGNLLLGLAAGYKTRKLVYGNRGHNQPVMNVLTGECTQTSQNHGYILDDSVDVYGWRTSFRNVNDNSNEGICHEWLPFSSVQFHPEAKGGPWDTKYLLEDFVNKCKS